MGHQSDSLGELRYPLYIELKCLVMGDEERSFSLQEFIPQFSMPRNTSAGSCLPAKRSITRPTRLELATSGVTGPIGFLLFNTFSKLARRNPPKMAQKVATVATNGNHQGVLFCDQYIPNHS
jgi:hypothetical protein